MLWKKTAWFWKNGFIAISVLLGASGCGDSDLEYTKNETEIVETADREEIPQQSEDEKEEKIIEICREMYTLRDCTKGDAKPAEENKADDLEWLRSVVNRLGENGYPAVDSKNQIDMAEAGQVKHFCEMKDEKKEAEITIVKVCDPDEFVTYDLKTKDGNVDVVRSYYKYENKTIQKEGQGSYQAEHWTYTEDGYLMFYGTWFSDEVYILTLSGAEEHTALRVEPLDEVYREYNRKYLLPISYARNNMFLTEWSEEDFGELNFYDMYDVFYPRINTEPFPYKADENLGVGAVYQIPKKEFEDVIMTYFKIDSKTLQSKTIYDAETLTYEYKPRGFYEIEYPEYPYSEVVTVTENSDGTITLTVHAVFPYDENSMAYAHEVVIRPFDKGGVQYVSNRMLPSADHREATWHTPRLTEEKWKELYGAE